MKDRFSSDTKDHVMTVELDSEVFRSLLFKKPGTSCYHYRITTWPGHLCISGDMGTFVFCRLYDMFEFFRGDKVNLQYWAGKIEATDRQSNIMSYNSELFKRSIKHYLDEYLEETPTDHVWQEIEETIDESANHSEVFFALREFSELNDYIMDHSEYDYSEYSHHYKWCCEAIIASIQQYDILKEQAA